MNYLLSLFRGACSFILGIGLITGIHEMGHLLVAKWCGMRVKRFMIFMPPVAFSRLWRGTRYGIGWIPLGGLVEIEGMIGEASEEPTRAPQPWEFRSKPAWQRFLVMAGGIISNLLSAYLIFVFLFLVIGKQDIRKEEINYHGIHPTELGREVGFQEGDRLMYIEGKNFRWLSEVHPQKLGRQPIRYTVLRGGKELVITVALPAQQEQVKRKQLLFTVRSPFAIQRVITDSVAAKLGLQKGDRILSVNGQPTPYIHTFREVLNANKGKTINITYERDGKQYHAKGDLSQEGVLGIELEVKLTLAKKRLSLGKAMTTSVAQVYHIAARQVGAIAHIIQGKVAFTKSMGGPIVIARMFHRNQGMESFFLLVALLSIMIALMNLLPIPALDGGHLFLTLVEMIIRKPAPVKWYVRLQTFGTLLLMGTALFMLFNDLYRLL